MGAGRRLSAAAAAARPPITGPSAGGRFLAGMASRLPLLARPPVALPLLAGLAAAAALACADAPPGAARASAAGSAAGATGPPAGAAGGELRVRWRAEPGLERLAGRLAADRAAWRPMPAIGPLSAVLDSVEVWIAREPAALEVFGPRAREPWVAGLADPAGGRIAVRVGAEIPPLRELSSVLRHELAHLALHAATGGNHPRWLDEGYAQLAAGEWQWEEAWSLRLAFFREGGRSLERISLRLRGPEMEARVGYLLSYTAVHHLLERGGEPGLRALFARLRAGDSLDGALRSVYGISETVLERQWRDSVLGRYGWLYALSRATLFWLAVALLVVGVAVRRTRRDRRRLEALREAEHREAVEDGEEAAPVDGPWGAAPGPGSRAPPGAGGGAGSHGGGGSER